MSAMYYKIVTPDKILIGKRPAQLIVGKSDLFKGNFIYQLYLREYLISSHNRGYNSLDDLLPLVKENLAYHGYKNNGGITGLILNTKNLSRKDISIIVCSLEVDTVALVRDNLKYIGQVNINNSQRLIL